MSKPPDPQTTNNDDVTLAVYDHLLLIDGVYGRRPLDKWETKRFGQLSRRLLQNEKKRHAKV